MGNRQSHLTAINAQIQRIYDGARGEVLLPEQKADVKELRALYRSVNLRRNLPPVRDPSILEELGLTEVPVRRKLRKRGRVKREPANVTPVRSVVSGGLPGLGKQR
ncbi:hypothetical protein [Ornithinimicrobium cavernae]|uniref:hypothetical protein n=1 Tax=Ornithinimicrobium cavernae TaxID=2666047 RepID=UPI0012B180DF|nr:hypothetical protein [Ornithinimicrobium cavernae]